MGLIPDTNIGKIEFGESHEDAFTTNHVAIGVTSAAVTSWTAKTAAARAAYQAQQAAKLALRNATGDVNMAVGDMMTATSALIKQIRAQADIDGDSVYTLASLPVPATPSPKPPPGQPTDLKVELGVTGELTLSWKCINPPGASGTTYNIFRRLGATGSFTYVGGVGLRKWTDTTVPAGSALIMYRIQGVRSTTTGPWNTFNVFLGNDGVGGVPVVTMVTEAMGKNAA